MWDTVEVVRVVNASVKQPNVDEFVTRGQIWSFVGTGCYFEASKYEADPDGGDRRYSRVTYWLRMRRNYNFYVTAILLPCVCLIFLQLGAFIMPPSMPDRSGFGITVLLSFAVLQQVINQNTPKTSQTILLIVYVSIQLIIGSLCTAYSLLACHLARVPSVKNGKCKGSLCGIAISISYVRALDVIAFSSALFCVTFANGIIFWLMTHE